MAPHPLPSTPYTGQKVIGVEPEATVEACLVQSLCFMAGETETHRGFVTDQLPSWQLTTLTREMATASHCGDQADPWTSLSCHPPAPSPKPPAPVAIQDGACLPHLLASIQVPSMADAPTREAVLQRSCLMAFEHCLHPLLLQNSPSSPLQPDLTGRQTLGALSSHQHTRWPQHQPLTPATLTLASGK